jgi:hypothetical protein
MAQKFDNNAGSTLAAPIASTDLVLVVASAVLFPVLTNPSDYFYATLADANEDTWEIVKVTATSGTSFSVQRGQDGTTALAWISGTTFEMRPVAQGLRDILAAAYARSTAMSLALG